jgi:hypothetical protein
MNKNAREKELLEEAYASLYEAKDDYVRLTKGSTYNVHNVNVRKQDKKMMDHYIGKGFRIVKPGEEDEEHPRDSMYLKDDPEALKKALAYHRRNVAKLSRKSFADLTDEEYDSLKHSEGELELNEGEEDNEGMSNLEALISSASEDGEIDIKQDGGTSAAAFDAEEKTGLG